MPAQASTKLPSGELFFCRDACRACPRACLPAGCVHLARPAWRWRHAPSAAPARRAARTGTGLGFEPAALPSMCAAVDVRRRPVHALRRAEGDRLHERRRVRAAAGAAAAAATVSLTMPGMASHLSSLFIASFASPHAALAWLAVPRARRGAPDAMRWRRRIGPARACAARAKLFTSRGKRRASLRPSRARLREYVSQQQRTARAAAHAPPSARRAVARRAPARAAPHRCRSRTRADFGMQGIAPLGTACLARACTRTRHAASAATAGALVHGALWRAAARDVRARTPASGEKKSQTNAVCQLRTDKVFVYFT
jgi:hypothetical protein